LGKPNKQLSPQAEGSIHDGDANSRTLPGKTKILVDQEGDNACFSGTFPDSVVLAEGDVVDARNCSNDGAAPHESENVATRLSKSKIPLRNEAMVHA
jgi:hypothetical protein